MKALFRTTAFFISFLAIVSTGARAQNLNVDQIIKGNEEAMGGPAALGKIQSMRMTTRIEQSGQTVETDTFWIKRPNLIRREASADGTKIVSGFDGSIGWALDPRKASRPQKDESAEFSNDSESIEANINWLAALKADGAEVKLIGKEEVKGAQSYKLSVGGKTYYLDTATFLPVRIDVEFFTASIAMYPADYRKIQGLFLPSTLDMEGRQVRIDYQFDVPMDDTLFRMPSTGK